jgi:peptide/nickel transport system substrate-binding protein
MRRPKPFLAIALTTALALLAGACGGDDDDAAGQPSATTTAEAPDKGGVLVLGAEQEPDCADWIAICAGASWGTWTMAVHTMPRAFDYVENDYRVSNLLTGEPELEVGPPQKVTYRIREEAVWSDGQPITSSDFKYTWDQIANGEGIYDKTGYDRIEAVDDSDPKVAVVTYREPFAGWRDLFGGFFGIYPSHLLEGKDRNALMKDGYQFSGGPWVIEAWIKGEEIRLKPNPNYWGDKPNLEGVVFKFITDTAAEQQAYLTGQVTAIYPQAQLELAQLRGAPDTEFKADYGLAYEAIWFNTDKPPLDEKAVRQAIAYATDRNAIVEQLFGAVLPGIEPLQAFVGYGTEYYTPAFEKYSRDLEKVDELMSGAGWTKGDDGIWAKEGTKATIENSTTAGNRRRELAQQILQAQWKEAGFELKINNTQSGTLFGEWGPQGVFQSAIYAQQPTPDPGSCAIWCARNIPRAENGNSGNNWTRLESDAIDAPWDAADKELDEEKRAELVRDGTEALAEEVPALPIDPFPDVLVWNRARIGGPIGFNSSYSMFWNLNQWFCRGGTC